MTPILILAGADYWIQFTYLDDTGTPVLLTSPVMELRDGPNTNGKVLYSSEGDAPEITFTQPTAGVLIGAIASAVTANVTEKQVAYWDCFATDPGGKIVALGSGHATITPNVSRL